jgi:hypothetical protein
MGSAAAARSAADAIFSGTNAPRSHRTRRPVVLVAGVDVGGVLDHDQGRADQRDGLFEPQ